MVSTGLVYDVMIDHDPSDHATADALGRRLRRSRLRPWLWSWSAVPGAPPDDEWRFAASASRIVVRIVGRAGLAPWLDGQARRVHRASRPELVVLAPGCRLSSHELPRSLADAAILDLRSEAGLPHPADALVAAIGSVSAPGGERIPSRRLDQATLKRDIIRSYDCIAEKFAAQWVEHPPRQALETFARLLRRGARVLDAGCGPGHHAQFLSACGADVTGVDLSEGMLRIARRRVRGLPFARMDIQSLDFPDRTFDGIWCAAAAIHVPREEVRALLHGFRRVLRPNGVLAINMQVGRASEVVDFHDDHRFFEYYRDGQEIANQVTAAGLVVETSDYGETSRNTHDADLTLKWVTVYARASGG